MFSRRDHIAKIDIAQKTHDEKWGFLNDLQPQVYFENFFFIFILIINQIIEYSIGCSI
jgi:hypothetical protein